jgi:hypothetical protein
MAKTTRVEPDKKLNLKSIYGVAISEDGKEPPLPEIPRWLIERWRRLAVPKVDKNWNRDASSVMRTMVAGFLLEPVSLRCFLTSQSMSSMFRLKEITELFMKRIETDNRALNHEERATLVTLSQAAVSFTEAANNICNAVDAQKRSYKKKGDDDEDEKIGEGAPPETPRFYKVNGLTPGDKK